MFKKLMGLALLITAYGHSALAQEWSANLGYNSDYIYRGLPQYESSVFGGIDFESGGFYAGTWAAGNYNNFGGPTLDYQFYSLTVSHNGFYGKLGTFEDDFDGSCYEAGYGGTLSVDGRDLLDYGVVLIHGDSTLLGGSSDTNIVLSLSRSFGF